jgi:hypothetical protein
MEATHGAKVLERVQADNADALGIGTAIRHGRDRQVGLGRLVRHGGDDQGYLAPSAR